MFTEFTLQRGVMQLASNAILNAIWDLWVGLEKLLGLFAKVLTCARARAGESCGQATVEIGGRHDSGRDRSRYRLSLYYGCPHPC